MKYYQYTNGKELNAFKYPDIYTFSNYPYIIILYNTVNI